MPAQTPRVAYQRSAVLTASQGQLLVMLYDGSCRFLAQAAAAMGEREFELAHNKLRRAELIINHLQASLDFERGGEIARRLAAIYTFCRRHLNRARTSGSAQQIDEVRGLLRTLREAWSQIS